MGSYPDEGQGLFRKRLMKIAPYNAFRPSTPDLDLHPGRHADTLRHLSRISVGTPCGVLREHNKGLRDVRTLF